MSAEAWQLFKEYNALETLEVRLDGKRTVRKSLPSTRLKLC